LLASAVSIRLRMPLPRFQWDRGSGFLGFNQTVEAASMRPQKRLRRFQWDCGILKKISTTLILHRKVDFRTKLSLKKFDFHGLHETAEADSAVSMRLRKRIERCQWEGGSRISGLNETAESFATPRKPLWKRIWALNSFKGIIWQKQIHSETLHTYSY
jgi:hypothetical protein